MKKNPEGGMLCLLGPYGDFFIDVLVEILTEFPDVAGFSFDGIHYAGVCYCKSCRDNYRHDTGKEIPNANLEDPAFRRYQFWADHKLDNLIRRMQNRLKGINPEVAIITWTTNAGRYGHLLTIPRNMATRTNLLFDAPDQEFWLDETNRGATVFPAFANAYIWATTNHRVAYSTPYLMSHGNPYGDDGLPASELTRRMLLTLTYGASPSVIVVQPPQRQETVMKDLDELKRRSPWLTHKKPEPWAALVVSDNTRNFYGRSAGKVEERYIANVLGFFRTAVEEHLPVALINDWNLNADDLSPYKVLILANTACLDERQVAAIDQYVRNGGGLVASLDVSLYDEFGDPRKNFALADVLGVDYRGLVEASSVRDDIDPNFAVSVGPDYWEKRKNSFDFKQDPSSFLLQGKMRSYIGDSPVTFKGPAVRVAAKDSQLKVLGTIRAKTVEGNVPDSPAIITRTHGKGRVLYMPAGFDAAYYLYAYPYQRFLLRNAINWAASAPSPIHVEAPMCVHTTLMRQVKEGQERLIVHLFNDVNTTAFHGLPNDDAPFREEVLPVHDIKLTFEPRYKFRRVHLEPENKELEIKRTENGSQIVVPRLDEHSMVVGELEPGAN
jgi:hypothetical protein